MYDSCSYRERNIGLNLKLIFLYPKFVHIAHAKLNSKNGMLLTVYNVWFMGFNATFNNISVIVVVSLLVEETGIPGENHGPVASH
jgi:hypothetical protein